MADILMEGIDISAAQQKVDFKKLKESGYSFVIIRAGYGKYTKQKDTMFESHYKGATEAGLHVGAYWYSYAKTPEDAQEEAKVCKQIIAGKKFDMPIYYDIEERSTFNTGAANVDKIATTFCSYMESSGYFCGIYGGKELAVCYLSETTRNRYAFWYAAYISKPAYSGQYGIWQFGVAGADASNNPTGQKSVPGVTGQCDMDHCYVDYPSKIISKGLNGYDKPTPTPVPAPNLLPYPEGFTPLLQLPEKGNPYYNTKSVGGYATCIVGDPTQEGLNVYSNCVGHAICRFNHIIGKGRQVYLNCPPNGEDVYARAISEGLEVSQEPSYGAIICFAKGKTGYSKDGAGHVGVVEQMYDDGTIVTSESGWESSNVFWLTKRNNSDGQWGSAGKYTFLGFVKNPKLYPKPEPAPDPKETCPYKEPTAAVKEGAVGEDVKWVQWYLTQLQYFDNTIDGIFEIMTLGSVLAFQFKNGLDVDGSCGKMTRNALISAYENLGK